jgi:hypothetical protein
MNAKTLISHFHYGLSQPAQSTKNSHSAILPTLKMPAANNSPEFKSPECRISEHEAIFLLQRRLMVK